MNTDCLIHGIISKRHRHHLTGLVGAYVALRGLSTWNRQLKGGVEYDLTRRILKCTYQWLREAIKGVRNPVMWGNEMPTPPETEASQMSRDELRHYELANTYEKRWNRVTEIRTELAELKCSKLKLYGVESFTKNSIQFSNYSKSYFHRCTPMFQHATLMNQTNRVLLMKK